MDTGDREEPGVRRYVILSSSNSLMRQLILHLIKKKVEKGMKGKMDNEKILEKFGYIDSSMTAKISHIDGYTEKDNSYFGKISDSEKKKVIKMPHTMKTCMVIMQKGIYDGYEISPGIESRNKHLKDLVMTKDDHKRYIVIKFESDKQSENPKLGLEQIITDSDKNTSLPRIFYAYRYIKQTLKINEYVLCTNGYFEDIIDNHELEQIEECDFVLHLDDDNKNYKIRNSLINKLKSLLKPYLSGILADRIIRCLLTNGVLEEDENSYFLKKEIIDMDKKRLREDFLKGDDRSEYATQLWEELNMRFRTMMILGLPNVERNKINLAWDFGSCENPNSGVYEKINDKELLIFFDEFKIATYMPSEKNVNKYFSSKIGTENFDIDKHTEKSYWKNNMKRVIDWLTFGGKGFCNQEIRNILKEDRQNLTNWYPSAEPLRFLVGRNSILKSMNSKLLNGEMLICTGMGGIGKSQLVNMYYKRFGVERFGENIVWLYAKGRETLESQFYDLTVNAMCIYNREQADTKSWNEIMKEIIEYYDGKKWLLVYDDALPYIFEKRNEEEERYLPEKWIKDEYPNIIITSRKQTWNKGTIIEVPVMEEDESSEVIVRNVNLKLDKQLAKTGTTIANTMGHFPMALYHSIVYINKRASDTRDADHNTDFTLEEFIKDFSKRPDKCFEHREENQNKQLYSNIILEVWNTTLEEIQEEKNGDKALEMLHLAAFLKNNEIPQQVFLDLFDNDEEALCEMIEMLRECSMIEVNYNNDLVIHEVFKIVIRVKISEPIKYGGKYKRPKTYDDAYERAQLFFENKTDIDLIEYDGDYENT